MIKTVVTPTREIEIQHQKEETLFPTLIAIRDKHGNVVSAVLSESGSERVAMNLLGMALEPKNCGGQTSKKIAVSVKDSHVEITIGNHDYLEAILTNQEAKTIALALVGVDVP